MHSIEEYPKKGTKNPIKKRIEFVRFVKLF